MQTARREVPGPTAATDLGLPPTNDALLAFQGLALLAALLGGPVLAATLGGALLAILVGLALLAGVVGLVWRVGLEFERAWLRSYGGPLLAEDERGADEPIVVGADTRAVRASELAGLGGTRAPAR
jgi:hypothetical protein